MDSQSLNSLNNKNLCTVLERFEKYRKYCKLLESNSESYLRTLDCLPQMPEQLDTWVKKFDGGILFTTSIFSTRNSEPGKFNRLVQFGEINNADFKTKNDIPSSITCFAMTNYGGYICYISSEESECIYEWDDEQTALTAKWDSFADWLDEEIDFAERLIQDGLLTPFGDIHAK